MRSTVTGRRVLLAAKTALAVGIAWWLAPLMPGVVDDYPYYAPFGVLVSMYPTFMGSVRTGLQTLYGLILGIILGVGVLVLGTPNVVSISLAVGAGILLAGLPRLGAGRDYIPVATLLVLIIGRSEGQAFSLGYGAQMLLGILVGLVVNVTVFPPLALDAAQAQSRRARGILIEQLDDAAAALGEPWPPSHEDWASRGRLLEDAVGEVRGAVHEAAESHRANPRARLRSRHRILSNSYADLAVLEDVTFHVRDLSEVLAGAIWEGPLDVRLRDGLREPLASCLSATADVLRAWDDGSAGSEVFDKAAKCLVNLTHTVATTPAFEGALLGPGATVALDVRRILTALRRRLLRES
ncbi:FUSC family protein [Arthrobacter sp. TMN-49]